MAFARSWHAATPTTRSCDSSNGFVHVAAGECITHLYIFAGVKSLVAHQLKVLNIVGQSQRISIKKHQSFFSGRLHDNDRPLLSPYAKDYHELLSNIVETRSNMISCACGRIHWSKNMNHRLHYIDAIVSAMTSQITSVLIFYPTVYSHAVQRNIKAPRHWPMWGEFTGDRWSPHTKGQ